MHICRRNRHSRDPGAEVKVAALDLEPEPVRPFVVGQSREVKTYGQRN
jgi:hypothetical protein